MTEWNGDPAGDSALHDFYREKKPAKKRENLEKAAITAAGRSVLSQFAALLEKKDLAPEDIDPSLILRRALYCAVNDEDAAALAYLKFVADMIALKNTLKKPLVKSGGSVLMRDKISSLLDED